MQSILKKLAPCYFVLIKKSVNLNSVNVQAMTTSKKF